MFDLSIDVYSGSIRCMYERYLQENVRNVCDATLLMDYRLVAQALTHALADDAKKMADQLDFVLEYEVSYRMNRWRVQAQNAADALYDQLTNFG